MTGFSKILLFCLCIVAFWGNGLGQGLFAGDDYASLEDSNAIAVAIDTAVSLQKDRQYDQAIEILETCIEKGRALLGEENSLVAFAYHKLGVTYFYKGYYSNDKSFYRSAIKSYLNAIAIRKRNKSDPNDLLKGFFAVSENFLFLEKPGSAIVFLKEAIELIHAAAPAGIDARQSAKIYHTLGRAYEDLRDFYNARQHYEMALAQYKAIDGIEPWELVIICDELSNVCTKTENFAKGVEYARQSCAYLETYPLEYREDSISYAGNLLNIAHFFFINDSLNLAEANLSECFSFLEQMAEKPNVYLKALNLEALILQKKGDLMAASTRLERLVAIGNPAKTPEFHQYLRDLAEVYLQSGDPVQAKENFLKSIQLNWSDWESFKDNPSPDYKNASVYNKSQLIQALRGNGEANLALFFNHRDSVFFLENAFLNYSQAIALGDYLMSSFVSQSSKADLADDLRGLYERRLECYFLLSEIKQLDYTEAIFQDLELSKYSILLENLNIEKGFESAIIDPEVVEKARNLRLRIEFHQNLIREKSNRNLVKKDSVELLEIRRELAATKLDYEDLFVLLEEKYSKFYGLRFYRKTTPIADIQNTLGEQSLLSFFVGDSTIYVFHITKDDQNILRIPKNFPLADWISKMRKGIFATYSGDTVHDVRFLQAQYVKYAHLLYEKLIEPLGVLQEQLIIIPDGVLGYVPFSALLTELPDDPRHFAHHAYLLRKHQISYNYSATLWQEMCQKKAQKGALLAFAPHFNASQKQGLFGRDQLTYLAHNEAEVDGIQAQIGGKVLKKFQATVQSFKDLVAQYSVLHIATHAMLNADEIDYSYLAFTPTADSKDYRIYTKDLYSMSMPLQMVVLSACETGVGELKEGEGIFSLARGFAYAGAKSIVHSLWSVNDQTSSKIMKKFYTYLSAKMPKDEALHHTKLTYLQEVTTHEAAHPFYWAAFTPIGDMSPIEIERGVLDWRFGGGIFILLLGFIFWKRFQ